jgi:hypothetical protein
MAVTEFKVAKVDFLDIIPAPQTNDPWRSMSFRKAITLSNISSVDEVLQLKYSKTDKFNPGRTIDEWVREPNPKDSSSRSPAQQLKDYWNSTEIKRLRDTFEVKAYLVVIIGSRKILLWPLGDDGQLGNPQLVG